MDLAAGMVDLAAGMVSLSVSGGGRLVLEQDYEGFFVARESVLIDYPVLVDYHSSSFFLSMLL